MILYPAIDLKSGRVVRLFQGDFDRSDDFGSDVDEIARRYSDAGADWIHVVDLDGAKDGVAGNRALLEAICRTADSAIQSGGGVRHREDVRALLACGVSRIVVGSAAIEQPQAFADWLDEFGNETLCLGLDLKTDESGKWLAATHGWQQTAEQSLDDILSQWPDLLHVLCTDISRDGAMVGPNLSLYQELTAQYRHINWQASGGVSGLEDISRLVETGVAGAVVGRALLDGTIDIASALEAAR